MSNPFQRVTRRKAHKFDEDMNVTIQPVSDTRRHFNKQPTEHSQDVSVEKPQPEYDRHSAWIQSQLHDSKRRESVSPSRNTIQPLRQSGSQNFGQRRVNFDSSKENLPNAGNSFRRESKQRPSSPFKFASNQQQERVPRFSREKQRLNPGEFSKPQTFNTSQPDLRRQRLDEINQVPRLNASFAEKNRQRDSIRSVETDEGARNDCWETIMEKANELMPEARAQTHTLIAFGLHLLLLVMGDHEFQFVQPTQYMQVAFIVGSLLASWVYMSNKKKYDIFSFEAVYQRMGGDYNVLNMRRDVDFYNELLAFFSKKYRGITFDWKVIDRSSSFKTSMEMIGDSIRRQAMPDSFAQEQNHRFLNSEGTDTVRCLEASIWQHNTIFAIYCLMLNPIIVGASLFCSTSISGIIGIDMVILAVLSQFQNLITHDDARMEGEGLLLQVNYAEQDMSNERERQKARKNGQILQKYIDMKQKEANKMN